MRIAIAQLNYKIGAFRSNLERMERAVASAREERADLVVFTELATIGYPPRDLLDRPDFVRRNLEQLERVAALSDEDLGLVVGYAEPNPSGGGKGLFNSAALCHGGMISHRLGQLASDETIRKSIADNALLSKHYESFKRHLGRNGIDLSQTYATLGDALKMDTKAEHFIGNAHANRLLTRDYRKPYVVPQEV